jgi:limonene-1,2-epoxide hydrolase
MGGRCDDGPVGARALTAVVFSAAALGACGGSDDEGHIPGGADPDTVDVIREWADELRAGDVEAAADRFEIPSTVQNGTPPLRLTDRAEVVAFNESLPCGAELTEAEPSGEYTIATFELTERPGPGECGSGVGETARTAFVVHDGRIAEWRRVVDAPPPEPPPTGPVV